MCADRDYSAGEYHPLLVGLSAQLPMPRDLSKNTIVFECNLLVTDVTVARSEVVDLFELLR